MNNELIQFIVILAMFLLLGISIILKKKDTK